VTFERPTSTRTARPRTVPATSAQSQAKPQARPAAAPGPRTTVESGVRVARGS
jgi:hypothetical protein